MKLVDTHCHLYLPEFKSDFLEMRQRARDAGIARFYLPAIDSETTEDMLLLEKKYPGEFFSMMGLHPCSVKKNYLEELTKVEAFLARRNFVAIGEIGLDFYWDKTFSKQQYDAFEKQMQWALKYRLPIIIHTRNAMRETIDAVKPFAEKGLTGIFHCFGEGVEFAKEIIDLGFYLGIGGVLTYKKSGLAETLKHLPLSRLVLETDAPFLAPVPYRGKRNESSYLKLIAEKLAEVKGIPVEEVASITTFNAEKIFGS